MGGAWAALNPSVFVASENDGALHLELTEQALWFQASRGALLRLENPWQGDFVASASVSARRTSNASEPPAQLVELGGLMARDPDGTSENYVFIVVGRDENDLSVETKSTIDSQSSYDGPTWPNAEAELRLCRRGATFRAYKREIGGGEWILAQTWQRPDLPTGLEVGLNVYSANAPDLTLDVDRFSIQPVSNDGDCTASDW